MTDYQDDNPYASPQYGAEPAAPEIHGIWRDGDELVVSRRNLKVPKACWITNKTGFLFRNRIACPSILQSTFLYLVLIAFMFGSCIGFLVLIVLWSVLSLTGFMREGSVLAWLSWSAALRQFASGLVKLALLLVNFVLCVLGFQSGNFAMLLVIVPLAAVTIVSLTYADRVLLGLHAVPGKDRTIRIRGVHPDYLARLPVYDGTDVTSAIASEPGDSPFGDVAT